MMLKLAYERFLSRNGVQREQADAIATGIANKIQKRKPLTESEAALTAAFLSRSGANPVTEKSLAVAVNGPISRSRNPAPAGTSAIGDVRISRQAILSLATVVSAAVTRYEKLNNKYKENMN